MKFLGGVLILSLLLAPLQGRAGDDDGFGFHIALPNFFAPEQKASTGSDSAPNIESGTTHAISGLTEKYLPMTQKWTQMWASVRGVHACPPPPYRQLEGLSPTQLANAYYSQANKGDHCEAYKAAYMIIYGHYDDLPHDLSHQQMLNVLQWAVLSQKELIALKLFEDAALQGIHFLTQFGNGTFAMTAEDTIAVRYTMLEALYLSAKKLDDDAHNYYRNSGISKSRDDGDFSANLEPLDVLLNMNNSTDTVIILSSFQGFTEDDAFKKMNAEAEGADPTYKATFIKFLADHPAEPHDQFAKAFKAFMEGNPANTISRQTLVKFAFINRWKTDAASRYITNMMAWAKERIATQPATSDPFRSGYSYAPPSIGAFLAMKRLYADQLINSPMILDALDKEIEYAFMLQRVLTDTSFGQPLVKDVRLEMLSNELFPPKDGQQPNYTVDRAKINAGLTKVVCRTRDQIKSETMRTPEWQVLQSDPATKAKIDANLTRIDAALAGKCPAPAPTTKPAPMAKKPASPKQG